ncbi:MAG: hypothetical protein EOP11_12180 [Proteobacteria bacterium]|nr:MAG: hypothetical protein EOP11_12180 [Pseudomonadota bacterium]
MIRNPFAKNLVGLDIGSRTVKALSLKKKGRGYALDKFFFYDLKDTAKAYPKDANPGEALRAGVSLQALQDHPFAAGVPDREVIHLALELPRLKEAELRTAVKHELSELTGIPAEELAFDFLVLDGPAEAEKISVSAYGSHRRHVDNVVKLATSARLKPSRVESDTIAIAAALDFNGYIERDKSYAVFDLGEGHLTASLVQGGEVRLSKTFENGWGSLNALLQEKFGISYAEAEAHKQRYDFNAQAGADPAIEQAIDEAYAAIFSDFKRSLELFADFSPNAPKMDQMLLTGGASQTPNLPRVLEMFFKVPVEAANPFRRIEIYAEGPASDEIGRLAPFMMAALGLALSDKKEAA